MLLFPHALARGGAHRAFQYISCFILDRMIFHDMISEVVAPCCFFFRFLLFSRKFGEFRCRLAFSFCNGYVERRVLYASWFRLIPFLRQLQVYVRAI